MRLLPIVFLSFSSVALGQEQINPRQLPNCPENWITTQFVAKCWGEYVWENGEKYVGEFIYGKSPEQEKTRFARDGQGKLTWPNGNQYVGEFKKGIPDGAGTFIWANGEKYVGPFYKDMPHGGMGTRYNADGTVKESGFFTRGKLVLSEGELNKPMPPSSDLIGQELNNPNKLRPCPEPGSTANSPDKCWGTTAFYGKRGDSTKGKYVGELHNGEIYGLGVLYYEEDNEYKGKKYFGEFGTRVVSGKGTLVWPNGDKYVGEFRDGKRAGTGTMTWVNGDRYVGEFHYDKLSGTGTFTWANGDKYIGGFSDNKQRGEGTFIWANGEKYVGGFSSNKKNGNGTIYKADGTIKESGRFYDDKLVKPK